MTDENYICTTCGVQYEAAPAPPDCCVICEEERQYVNPQGQAWVTQADLGKDHHNLISGVAPGLWQIHTEPPFGIGQRAFIVQTPTGNILWDCISYLDDDTKARVNALGGLQAIAISHPHFYSAMVDWSLAFGGVPVYLHQSDQTWVQRPGLALHFWDARTLELGEDLTIIRTGGHFPGSCVLHWRAGAGGRGLLLTGDSVFVNMDRKSVSFMYSYPNLIPLRREAVEGIRAALAGCAAEQIYGAFDKYILENGRQVLDRSLERYLQIYS
jgi:glyoxylase-like metal-dependent hydrolase (beta-lactamase superfamily II)